MGLGRFPDVSLFDARQHALSNKQLLRKNIDPIDEKNRAEVLRQQQNKKFSEIADLYISTKKKDEWTNPKSEQAWRSTITNYALPYLDKKPLMFSILATSFLLIKLDFIEMTPTKFELNFGIIVARFRNLFRRIACGHARNHSLGFRLAVIVAHSRCEVNLL